MKRNGMCPICYIKQIFTPRSKVTKIEAANYDNNAIKTPPMGWSSWNTFRNNISEELIYETAILLKEKGLLDAGYKYINLDDNWHSSLRDKNGELQGDLLAFPSGIPSLVKKCNSLGFKVGIYSSNGALTCEDLPASQGNEERDAYTFAKWGIEYFKYDFCHNKRHSKYAPLVYGITLSKRGQNDNLLELPCQDAKLFGLARFMPSSRIKNGYVVSGLDRNKGAMEYDNIYIDSEGGEYILSVNIKKKGGYSKFLMVLVNNKDSYTISFPPQKFFNHTARFQIPIILNKGKNSIRLFNPIGKRGDSAMLQYRYMGQMLKEATARVAEEQSTIQKPIVYSICEWGRNQPWKWGKTAGNLWRTTGDIRPWWWRIMQLYEKTVKMHLYSTAGGYNDPDMLEVGNGKLSYQQNLSHFSLWCMMNAPLILGNDIRVMPDKVREIVTNKDMISINQDSLSKQAKRIKKSSVDILVKPLAEGRFAVCFFNKSRSSKQSKLHINSLKDDGYLNLTLKDSYDAFDVWEKERKILEGGALCATIPPHGVKVFILS